MILHGGALCPADVFVLAYWLLSMVTVLPVFAIYARNKVRRWLGKKDA